MIRRHLNGFWNFKKAANDTAFKIPISVLKYILVLWTELLMKTGHCREFQKLTFEALAILQQETIFCSDKGLPTHDMSALETLRWPIYIINSVHKTKLSLNTPYQCSSSVSFETNPLYSVLLIRKSVLDPLCLK